MDIFVKLTGLISELLFILLIIYCWKIEKSFAFSKNTFSYFGTKEKTKRIFNFGLFLIIMVRLFFIYQIFTYFSLLENPLLILFGGVAFVGGFIASLVSADRRKKTHRHSANISAIFSTIFIVFLAASIINSNFYLGVYNLFISILLFIQVVYLIKVKKVSSVFEIVFLSTIILWDNVMTLKLFNII